MHSIVLLLFLTLFFKAQRFLSPKIFNEHSALSFHNYLFRLAGRAKGLFRPLEIFKNVLFFGESNRIARKLWRVHYSVAQMIST
jgi:hypothetical protein